MKKVFLAVLFILFITTLSFGADVTVKWDVASNADGYKVYMSEDLGVSWTGQDAGTATQYTWTGAPDDKLILFNVSSYNAVGESIWWGNGVFFDGTKVPPGFPTEITMQ
jgi:hypothetical protein